MDCRADLIFKSIVKKEGGTFTDSKTGEARPYNAKYVVKCDEVSKLTGEATEHEFNLDLNNTTCASKLLGINPYQTIPCMLSFTKSYSNAKQYNVTLLDCDITKAVKKQ